MRIDRRILVSFTAAVAFTGYTAGPGAAHDLSTGTGDGSLQISVDGYGAFGSSIDTDDADDAIYDPVGPEGPAGTVFESGVAARVGTGPRQFLTSGDIGGSGDLPSVPGTGTSTTVNTSFIFANLNFNLTQTVSPLFGAGGERLGSQLTQAYVISNLMDEDVNVELIRYQDGDLLFDDSLEDGGGRVVDGGTEVLFETDSATGAVDPTTFVGLTGSGGTDPSSNRYEADSYSGLRGRIISGTALDDTVTGDGPDADQFVDNGNGYDITLALRNVLTIPAGGTGTYITETFWGTGEPDDVPEPAALALLAPAVALLARRRRKA